MLESRLGLTSPSGSGCVAAGAKQSNVKNSLPAPSSARPRWLRVQKWKRSRSRGFC